MSEIASGDDLTLDVIDRLHAECPLLQSVNEAWFAEPIDDLSEELPAAFVYLDSDTAEGGAETLRPVQAATQMYGVWLVAPRDQFRELRKQVRAALFAHDFSPYHDPMEYRSGQQADVKGRYVWWLEMWSTDTHIR
ncbi:hypothetical protein F0A16_20650 [Salinicola corii]|uniref:Uncharacterized protein n=1 Tax=Salinicola corii TaxID=2606937 RepID=A0A640W7I2_9GAMM|nr:hypothetical protein [Salinicola corii]KAA0015499.1 hypothetical protein F0A16_20650 [Salinicola corii]